ncbi:MAG TPA: aldehyde reductase [Steroidobacteraceae bacterium]|nr:aldehyde reductase [Steroidobacteraceae bacterium]
MSTVLVTGGSGFIAGHCILKLAAAGHRVRTTVRSRARATEVRDLLGDGGRDLSFVVADLGDDAGWAAAVQGADYVLHVASPFPPLAPRQERELIEPAREGTLRVLRAARDARVKRVVLTSSFAAIGYGHGPRQTPFDETCWSNLDGPMSAYARSKTLAERAAWTFLEEQAGAMELSVVNPVAVLGPAWGPNLSASIRLIERMLKGGMPGAPRLYFGVVDVRDVADLHLLAMLHPAARAQRFLAAAGEFMSLLEIAQVLRGRLGAAANRAPTRELPNWLLRLVALCSKTVRELLPELGKIKNATHLKAERLLGWKPRSNEESIVAAAQSLLQRAKSRAR